MSKDVKTVRITVSLSNQIRRIPSSKPSTQYSKNPWICQGFYPSKSKPQLLFPFTVNTSLHVFFFFFLTFILF